MGLSEYYNTFKKMNEREYSQMMIINDLSKWFDIEEQVSGVHFTGRRQVIDAVISPKNNVLWKNKRIVFGVEFKSPSNLQSLGSQLDYARQCIDYSYTNFEQYGYIPILACPKFSFDEHYSNEISSTLLKHFISKFGVGELDYTSEGLSIIFAEHHIIWANGIVREGERWNLKNRNNKDYRKNKTRRENEHTHN